MRKPQNRLVCEPISTLSTVSSFNPFIMFTTKRKKVPAYAPVAATLTGVKVVGGFFGKLRQLYPENKGIKGYVRFG